MVGLNRRSKKIERGKRAKRYLVCVCFSPFYDLPFVIFPPYGYGFGANFQVISFGYYYIFKIIRSLNKLIYSEIKVSVIT